MLRRLRIYFTGFGIGLIMVYLIFGRDDSRDLDIWTPSQRILEAIVNDSTLMHGEALACYKACLNLDSVTLTSFWKEAQVKSLNPGGDPYRYLISYRSDSRHLEAEVKRENDIQTLVYLKDNQNPSVCECP